MSREGRKGKTSIKGTMMMLFGEETPTGPGTKMGMISMKETPGITRTLQAIDQPGALMIGETLLGSDKKSLLKTNDLLSVVLRGSPGRVGFSVDSEVKIGLEQPMIYTTYSMIAERGMVTIFLPQHRDQKLSRQQYRHK